MSDTVKALKQAYKTIDELYIISRDSFHDCERKEFHLLVSAECLTLSECKNVIAEQIIKELEKEQ